MRKITRLTSLLIAVLFASTLVFAQNNTMTTSATKPVDAKEAKTEIKNASISVYQPFIEKKTSSKPYDPAMHPSPRQGGDDIASAVVIPSIPYSNSGTTAGYTDDYDEVCPYTGSTAPDVVYAFTPGENICIDIDLCGSSYDTKLYVYENAHTPGSPFACNDDYYGSGSPCGDWVSALFNLELTGGNTYYIVIDGYDGASSGEYIIEITPCGPPCIVECPVGSIPESELCGEDLNGGCNNDPDPPTFESVNPNDNICGTLWADGGTRDTDWFELVLATPAQVILHADAQVLMNFGLLDYGTGTPGNPICPVAGFLEITQAGPCSPSSLDLGVLVAGAHWIFTGLTVFEGFPCDVDYWIEFEVIIPDCPPPSNLTLLSLTTTEAEISWTPGGSEPLWNVEVGLPGFTPGTGADLISVYGSNENPWTAKDLDPLTAYEFYVQADCGAEGVSIWAGPYAFTTLCEFDCPVGSIAENEPCGDDLNGGCNMVTPTFESINAGDVVCGTLWAIGGSRDTDWYELVLTSPSEVIIHADGPAEILIGLVDTDPNNPTCPITSFVASELAGPCAPAMLNLGILTSGTYWIFAGLDTFEGYPCDVNYFIEFEVNEIECPPPTDLYATNITTTSADLGWTPSGTEAMWHVEVGVPGFAPGTGTALLSDYFTPDNPWLASPLNPGMDYEFYVKAYCNGFENPKIDRFWMAMPGFGVLDPLLSGGTMDDPGETGEWYFYENAPLQPWWNIWFYNGEFVPENMKKVRMGFWVQSLDGINPGEIQFVVNWSTPEWSLLPDPPTPFPMPMDEFYIERSPINPPMIVDPVGPQWIEFYYIIEDYNPEWISVDIWGANIQILEEYLIPPPPESALAEFWTPGPGGIIVHECLPKDHSSSDWGGPVPFSTLCLPVDVPLCENFDGVTAPVIPDCWTVTNDNDDTNLWETDTSNPNSAPNAMAILYNTTLAMDDWFFSPGLNLEGGVTYQVDFYYRAGGATFPESMEVLWGTYPDAAGMTGGLIWDNNSIINETYELGTGTFTPPTTGVYYVGWHGYSAADQFILYVDDICIAEEEPEVPENRTVDGVTISDLDDECFDATNTITVTNTVVESGGIANFIAGVNIIFGEGFIVENGGYMWARIDNVYCNPPALLSAIEEAPEVMLPEITASESFFKVFPNPTTSTFKLELLGADEAARINVEIYGMMGERVFQDVLFGGLQYEFDLSNMPKGIYFIRVLMGDEMGIEKVIKQ